MGKDAEKQDAGDGIKTIPGNDQSNWFPNPEYQKGKMVKYRITYIKLPDDFVKDETRSMREQTSMLDIKSAKVKARSADCALGALMDANPSLKKGRVYVTAIEESEDKTSV